MPRRIEDVARELVATVDADAGFLLGARWLIKRYEQLATRTKLRHLRQVGQLSVPAPITAGTVDVTRGTTLISGDATAQAAWSPQVVGWHIRVRTSWYEVTAHAPGQLSVLGTIEEDSVDDGSYTLAQRWVPLHPSAAAIGDTFVHARLRRPIHLKDYSQLHNLVPARDLAAGGPQIVAEAPRRPAGPKQVEFYPISSTSENYFYLYWTNVGDLEPTDYLPPEVSAYALIEGALIDLYRYKMAQVAGKNVEQAAFWRNEMRTQETKWEKYILELIGNDRGEDDQTFLLRIAGQEPFTTDIMTAQQHIRAGWEWTP